MARIVAIDDPTDPRIAVFRSLKTSNETRRSDLFVLEGEKLLRRVRSSRYPIVSILTHPHRVQEFVKAPGWPEEATAYVASRSLIGELVGFRFHQGVLTAARRVAGPSWDDVAWERGIVIVCPDLLNPENLGAIVRIGDVFGADAVLVGPTCPDPLSRRVLRVSMGCVLDLPVLVVEDAAVAAERLRDELGFELVAAVADPDAEPADRFGRPARLGLVLGNESEGLSPDWLVRCRRRITIPMRAGADSLNVNVAAGILLYELTRTRLGSR